jgi:hypothetical protein
METVMIFNLIHGNEKQSSYTRSLDENSSEAECCDFEEFISDYPTDFKTLAKKEYGSIFVGCEFDENGIKNSRGSLKKCAENIVAYHFLVLDYDDGTTIKEMEGELKVYSYLMHSSYSHRQLKNGVVCDRFRVIIPLRTPVTCEEFASRKQQLVKLYPTADEASFSICQGFLTPSRKTDDATVYLNFQIAIPFDLLALSPSHFEMNIGRREIEHSDEMLRYREENYQSKASAIIASARFTGMKRYAAWLRKNHAERPEIAQRLQEVVNSFPLGSRQAHQLDINGIVEFASQINDGFVTIIKDEFSPQYVTIEDAQLQIVNALNGDDDISVNVTAGVGKSRIAIDYAITQALAGKEVALYVASHSFQNELLGEINKLRSQKKEQSSTLKFPKSTYVSIPVKIISRNERNCDFYKEKIIPLLERQKEGEIGAVSDYCYNYCLYSPNNGAGCHYAEQFKILNKVRIYTHAHLFSKQSLFDKEYSPDVVIIDEDPFSSAHVVDEYDVGKANALEKSHKRVGKHLSIIGNVGLLIKELTYADISTPQALYSWCLDHQELIINANKEQKLLAKFHRSVNTDKKHAEVFKEHYLIDVLTQILANRIGINNILVKDNVVKHTYLRVPTIPHSARVISLDATGDPKIINALLRRPLKAIKIDVDTSQYATIIQVKNTGASQYRITNHLLYNKARIQMICKRAEKKGTEILTKRNQAESPLYFGNCRGSNLYSTCSELHIAMNYNLPPNAIDMAARAIFGDSPEPFIYKDGNLQSERKIINGLGITVSNLVYVDPRAKLMDAHLARAELEQAVHRARPVRRTSTSRVKIIIHTNRVLNIKIDNAVKWQDLYQFQDKHALRSIDALDKFKDTIYEASLSGLIWKSKNVKATGVTQAQWNSYKDIAKLDEKRFTVVEVTYKTQNRKLKTECAIFSCGFYNNDYIETALSFGALLSLFDAKQIIMVRELFGGLEITNAGS